MYMCIVTVALSSYINMIVLTFWDLTITIIIIIDSQNNFCRIYK